MALGDVASGVGGTLLMALVATDIFRSLLVPRSNHRALRLGPVLGRLLFPLWHGAAGLAPKPGLQQTLRAGLAPFLLVMSLLIWAGLLILGFGLIFWADRASFHGLFHRLSDAIYVAGGVFATLDVPDGVTGTFARIAAVACALGGLAIVTVVATFLISIQSGFSRREALVLRLEAHVTLPPAGIAILEAYASEHIVGRLGAFFDAWEAWSAEVAISHRAFPILLFFRSNDSRCEWLAALGAVLDAAALLDATVEDAPAGARAAAHFLLRTGARLLCDTADLMVDEPGAEAALADAARFDAHRARLERAGYRLVADRDAAILRFIDRRRTFAPALIALADRLRIEVDQRRGDDPDSEPQP